MRTGRPKQNTEPKVKITVYVPTWVREFLKTKLNQSEFVEKALIKYGRIKKPK